MATATLTWTPPTVRVPDANGVSAPLAPTDIASANIFDAGNPIGSVTGATGTFTTGVLTVGTHAFTVETIDTTGHVSAMSNVANVTVVAVLASPAAVTDLAATLNP